MLVQVYRFSPVPIIILGRIRITITVFVDLSGQRPHQEGPDNDAHQNEPDDVLDVIVSYCIQFLRLFKQRKKQIIP